MPPFCFLNMGESLGVNVQCLEIHEKQQTKGRRVHFGDVNV